MRVTAMWPLQSPIVIPWNFYASPWNSKASQWRQDCLHSYHRSPFTHSCSHGNTALSNMVDLSQPALKQAYEDVRNDNSPTTWYADCAISLCLCVQGMVYLRRRCEEVLIASSQNWHGRVRFSSYFVLYLWSVVGLSSLLRQMKLSQCMASAVITGKSAIATSLSL